MSIILSFFFSLTWVVEKMTKLDNILELLNTLIHVNVGGMINISNNSLCDIKTCLQYAQEKIEFL